MPWVVPLLKVLLKIGGSALVSYAVTEAAKAATPTVKQWANMLWEKITGWKNGALTSAVEVEATKGELKELSKLCQRCGGPLDDLGRELCQYCYKPSFTADIMHHFERLQYPMKSWETDCFWCGYEHDNVFQSAGAWNSPYFM